MPSQLNGLSLEGATHAEIAQFVSHGSIYDVNLLVTSRTKAYVEYSKVLRNIRNETVLPMEFCEKLRNKVKKTSVGQSATTLRQTASV